MKDGRDALALREFGDLPRPSTERPKWLLIPNEFIARLDAGLKPVIFEPANPHKPHPVLATSRLHLTTGTEHLHNGKRLNVHVRSTKCWAGTISHDRHQRHTCLPSCKINNNGYVTSLVWSIPANLFEKRETFSCFEHESSRLLSLLRPLS